MVAALSSPAYHLPEATALINRLEDSDTQIRRNQVYRLKNIPAVDAAAALRDFLERSLSVFVRSGQLTTYQ